MKKNSDAAIIKAMAEMEAAGLPVEKFERKTDADFFFSRDLTRWEKRKAKEIAGKYIDAEWRFVSEKGSKTK